MGLIEVKLRPTGPWRAGHRAGDRERVDVIYHSDRLFSAITHAMRVLGWMEEWLDATARATGEPAARFSSLFPYIGKTRLIVPPGATGLKLAPLGGGRPPEQQPYTVSIRSAAAVDRLTGAVEPHRVACLEFAPNAGMWGVFEATPEWDPKVRSAFRLLADSGFGGERSRGWGRSQEPIFSTASALFPDRKPNGKWWLLGVFSPAESDRIDWTKSEHAIAVKGGWTDSPAGAAPKKQVRMLEEGSVLVADELTGRTVDVAPEGFPHPVYRNGQPLLVPVPAPVPHQLPEPDVEQALPPASEPEPSPEPHVEQALPPALAPPPETASPEPEPPPASEPVPHEFPEPAEPTPVETPDADPAPAPEPASDVEQALPPALAPPQETLPTPEPEVTE
jgi:CRISPR/Cas system CSM-associated protein Csm4 (group 5 of RAMP superfamily)